MFMVSTKVNDRATDVTLELPYIPSYSFGELAFANVSAERLVANPVVPTAACSTSCLCRFVLTYFENCRAPQVQGC